MGLIVKTKADGSKKGRLVHDLRRSDVNSHIVFEERLVLPRLRDAVEDVLSLMESSSPEEQILLMSADFADAFKQLPAMHRKNDTSLARPWVVFSFITRYCLVYVLAHWFGGELLP